MKRLTIVLLLGVLSLACAQNSTEPAEESTELSGEKESIEPSGEEELPGTPGVEESSETPGEEESPGTPGAEESSGTPGEEESAGTPGVEESSGTPGEEESAGTPGAEESSGTSGEEESSETSPTESTVTPSELDGCLGECPANDTYYGTYLAHQECSKFCQCGNGQLFVLSCPANLHFNTVLDVCDWPELANCTGEGGIVVVPPEISNLPAELPVDEDQPAK